MSLPSAVYCCATPVPAEWVATLSEKTGLSRFYVVVGLSVLVSLVVFFGVGAGFFCNVVGFVYPAYASFKAIESPDGADDTQWLTYWVVYAFFVILETFADLIMSWLPFYYALKFAFLLYCMHPRFNGAVVVYNDFIKPFLATHEKTVDRHLNKAAGVAGDLASEGIDAAKKAGKAAINKAVESGVADKIAGAIGGEGGKKDE